MTSASKTFGRPPTYPLGPMKVGDSFTMPAPTSADIKRICRNVSQYGTRHGKGFTCRLDKTTARPVMHVTRLR